MIQHETVIVEITAAPLNYLNYIANCDITVAQTERFCRNYTFCVIMLNLKPQPITHNNP